MTLYPKAPTAPAPPAGPALSPPPRQRTDQREDELHRYIAAVFGVRLPRKVFTAGHSSPFAFVADAWFSPGADLAAWANRSGCKTLALSIIAAMAYQAVPALQGRVLAGSEEQAGCIYGYWTDWARTVLGVRGTDIRSAKTTLGGGGRFEIVPATQTRVRGPKVQLLLEDEVDEIPQDVEAAAVGMLASRGDIPAATLYGSTWHRTGGTMGKIVMGSPANGVRIHKWNLWESLENCPPAQHKEGEGCRTCPLGPACLAKAAEVHAGPWPVGIASECEGLLGLSDACKAYRKLDRGAWQAEYECSRPQADGLVYPSFSPGRHGLPAGGLPPLTIYRAIDWGYLHFVCLWIGVDRRYERVYLLDTYVGEKGNLEQHARAILASGYRNIEGTFCDPAGWQHNDQTGRTNAAFLAARGIECRAAMSTEGRSVAAGIRLVRSYLDGADGSTRFFYVKSPGNLQFERAMENYVNRRVNGIYVDEPEEPQEFEHIPDALRYFFVGRFADRGITVKRLGVS